MHDNIIDRTSTGKGRPEDSTWEELRKMHLRSGTGHPTLHTIPAFKEMLLAANKHSML